ncbi:hypothetical protein MMB17_04780 [Methylobacterium organophilum]|uniref:hypothetical protein n=1 Tax=Methylobacterium organophilum TaxID=410 RepID=UPI001F12DD41|nr:hypothetical protein [Methylobacterium organophilum]UMY18647.1 hypothetical protein MMB17_04780 [Methylobacterium organophilum]
MPTTRLTPLRPAMGPPKVTAGRASRPTRATPCTAAIIRSSRGRLGFSLSSTAMGSAPLSSGSRAARAFASRSVAGATTRPEREGSTCVQSSKVASVEQSTRWRWLAVSVTAL